MTSARRAFQSPVVSASIICPLAAAIALSTVVFAVIEAVWLRALPFPAAEDLVVVGRAGDTSSSPRPRPISAPELRDWIGRSTDFDSLAAISVGYGAMSAQLPNGVRTVDIAAVTSRFFSTLGIPAAFGRTLDDGAEPRGIVLGYTFWQRAFGGDSAVIGKSIRLKWFENSTEYEVIGVMPRAFQVQFPEGYDAYILAPDEVFKATPSRAALSHTVFGRIAEGRSLDAVRLHMKALGDALGREYPDTPQQTTVAVMPLHEFFFGRTRPILLAVAGAAVFILVLASANTSSILLIVTLDRSVELATRAALGADRWRLALMLVKEHALLGAVAGFGGLAIATAGVGFVRHIAPPELPRSDVMAVNWNVAMTCAGIALVAIVGSVIYPVWRLARVNPGDDLRRGPRVDDVRGRSGHRIFMTAQTAIVVTLLLLAGLLFVSLREMLAINLGFEPHGLIAVRARFLLDNYGPAGALLQDRLTREVLSRPGVVGAGWTSEPPLGPPTIVRLKLADNTPVTVRYRIVSAEYFETIHASLHQGRTFERRDRDADPVVVVNRSFADRYFPSGDALGRDIFIREWHRIVGILNDVREGTLSEPEAPTVYWDFSGRNWMAGAPWLVVRVRDGSSFNPDALRSAVAAVDATLPTADTERIVERVMRQTATIRFLSGVLGGAAGVALVIAAGGIFGLIAYSVRRRTQELAIRIALGANHRSVTWQVLKGVAAMAGAGIMAGVGLSWVTTRFVRAFLFGVAPNDPEVVGTVVVVVGLAFLAASIVPLRRALTIAPADALRHN